MENVVIHYRGAQTMYRFGMNKEIVVADIPKEDIALYVMGEIDCRVHIHKHQPWRENIEMVVANYLDAIRFNNHPNSWIYGIVPSVKKELMIEDPECPFIGSNEDRKNHVIYMNELLRASEFTFVDVWSLYADSEGYMIYDLSDHHVHIENKDRLEEYVNKMRG
jgi:hypothetical protein